MVDFTSGINLYPKLRLVNNVKSEYQKSIATIRAVMKKMSMMNCTDMMLSFHQFPAYEYNWQSFNATFINIANEAKNLGIQVHLRNTFKNPFGSINNTINWIEEIDNLDLIFASKLF